MLGLYLDHNVALEVAELLRRRGHLAIAARDLGLERATDDVQLLTAAERGLILLSHDTKDYPLLHDAWRRWSNAWNVTPLHHGILIVPQQWSRTQIVDMVDAFLATAPTLTNELYRYYPALGWVRRP
jgi:predicted nuclease of predicted toxin-antitoxin system